MQKHIDTLKKIISGKTSWQELKEELSFFNQSKTIDTAKTTIAGSLFEVFTKYYFKTMPSERDNYKEVYFYSEIPLYIKEKMNLSKTDYGIDILLEDYNGKYWAVQCKFKNDEKTKLSWSKDKISNLFALCPKADGYIVFTNASELDSVSKNRYENFSFYNISDLLQMDGENFTNIYRCINNKEIEHIPKNPYPHQTKAINACVNHFKTESRGQLILPCGAGKTLTALWIKEKLESTNTLVLVPSLALLKQIKNDWAKEKKDPYHYLCNCSETDIDSNGNSETDCVVQHTYEVGGYTPTKADEIQKFLLQSCSKVIFSTYQSLSKIETAIKNTDIRFDFVFCDEAHKTAVLGDNAFSLIHDDEKIPARKRLYATATPRILSDKIKEEIEDDFIYSYDMSNPAVFGKEIYRMTFNEAIERGILVDYQIIAIGVNDKRIQQFIEQRRFTTNAITFDEAANNYALEYVMGFYNASHALSFHSRIKSAREFAERHDNMFNDFRSFFISGDQTTSERNIILSEFKSLEKSVISNARCLTEGVDVPAIDLVYFCDPKNSKIDIVQAVGRALRKKDGKKMGYVVVPIYHSDEESLEEVINGSVFNNLIQVIRSLCDHDERLQAEINNLSRGEGKKNKNYGRLVNLSMKEETEPIILLGFEEKLANSLFNQIISKTANRWDVRYEELIEYRTIHPDRWPVYDKKNTETNESKLGIFCEQLRQQFRKGTLNEIWKNKLEELNFNFRGIEDNWTVKYNEIKNKIEKLNSVTVAIIGKNENEWIMRHWKDYKKNELNSEKTELIKNLNLERFFSSWDEVYSEIVAWKAIHGKLPTKNSNKKLNDWLVGQRNKYRRGNLSDEQKGKLISVGYDIDIVGKGGYKNIWNEMYHSLIKFRQLNPFKWPRYVVKEEEKLFGWCQAQRQRQAGTASKGQTAKLEDWQVERLDSIGFMWDGNIKKLKNWNSTYAQVKKIIETNGRQSLPTKINGKFHPLYTWITTQKSAFKKGKLAVERIDLLRKIEII